MKQIFFPAFVIFFLTSNLFSQSKENRLLIGAGPSWHGTGDLKGYSVLNQWEIELGKNFFIVPGIQFTNHAQTYLLTNEFNLNYVTAGVNIFTNIQYSLLNKKRHRIALGAGPVLRFQNSSVPSEVASNLGQSGSQLLILKYDKLRSVSLGYNFTPAYYYQLSKKLFIGTKFILQNDTEGDIITSALVFLGVNL